jgi:hypothetical protein
VKPNVHVSCFTEGLIEDVLCKKRKRGVILLGDFWSKSNPNGKENFDGLENPSGDVLNIS